MANNFTAGVNQKITNELLLRLINNLGFSKLATSKEYNGEFAQRGAKIGDTLYLRKPQPLVANTGSTLVIQDLVDASTPLTINTELNVGFEILGRDMALSVDEIGERYLEDAAIAIANRVDVDGLTLAYQTTPNVVGTPGTPPTDAEIYLSAGEALDRNSAPMDDRRYVVTSPKMNTKIVKALSGLFNDPGEISHQYKEARMRNALGFWWAMDQNVRSHVVGPLGGTPLVAGAGQTGSTLVTDGWTAAAANRLKKGDIFTYANGYAVNAVSGDVQQDLRQFEVTSDAASDGAGNLTVSIYPPIITTGPTKTVSASPADNAPLTILGSANTVTPQGIAFHKHAYAFAMVAKPKPGGVEMTAVATDPETGISIRTVQQYEIRTDLHVFRVDGMYGWAPRRPEWGCRIAS